MAMDSPRWSVAVRAVVAAFVGLGVAGAVGCAPAETQPPKADTQPPDAVATPTAADSFGALPSLTRTVPVHGRRDLVESSAAATSARQPGIVFTINDSGNEPFLFALDTTGADRGAWRITGATNVDWESLATGPCGADTAGSGAARTARSCLYIGDTGDNDSVHQTRVIYRVAEPDADSAGTLGALAAERLTYRYSGGPRDVESMYVTREGRINLITKRALKGAGGAIRPVLVHTIDPSAWGAPDVATAVLTDSLAIVPTPGPFRQPTDAALSPDSRFLAVRTYFQIYVFAMDSVSGTVRRDVSPALCNVSGLEERVGEGLAWLSGARLVLTSEGRNEPLHIVQCPLPNG
jgi:hypothetical protein